MELEDKHLTGHYSDVIMGVMAPEITSLSIVYSAVYSGADQRKHQSSASMAFVRGIHRWPVNSPHKWPVTWKKFPFDDVIMIYMLFLADDGNLFYTDYGMVDVTKKKFKTLCRTATCVASNKLPLNMKKMIAFMIFHSEYIPDNINITIRNWMIGRVYHTKFG